MSDDKYCLFKQLKTLYNEYCEDTQLAYRLVKFTEENNKKIAVIGLRHSRYYFKLNPRDAIKNKAILAGLSKEDVSNLSMYAVFCEMQPRYELSSTEYISADLLLFTFKDKEHNTFIKLTDQELKRCPEVVKKLKDDDQFKMGYLCGSKNERNNS